MHIESNGINTWVSPKYLKKILPEDMVDKVEAEQKSPDKQKVDANLFMASMGICNLKNKQNVNKSSETDKLISPMMQAGNKNNLLSIMYINDVHGKMSNMEKITTASMQYDSFIPEGISKMKFSAGDTMLGANVKVNTAASMFLNANNFLATVVGNHEVDQNVADFLTATKDATYKILGSNAKFDNEHQLGNKIIQSYVQEDDKNNKYGVIALMPFDLALRSQNTELFKGLEIEEREQTKKDIQKQIDELEEQGINRIIMLSHAGYESDMDFAQSVKGLDIIIGGHSHDLVTDLNENKNLFIEKEEGAPTLITQAGRDGNYYGILNVEFDENGEIIKAENNVISTAKYERNTKMRETFDSIMGKAERAGVINSSVPAPGNFLKEENPHASFLADIMKEKYNTDLAFINAGNLRGSFEQGEITTRDVAEIFPFKENRVIINITEKDLVEAMKVSASSMSANDGKPGLLQVAGLKYSVNTNGELLGISVPDKDGTERTIDINSPDENRTYSVATSEFLSKGLDGFTSLNKYDEPESVVIEDYCDEILIEYMQNTTEPINIKSDGRIQIVEE